MVITEIETLVREMVEGLGTRLAPDEDWIPVMFLFDKDGTAEIALIPQAGYDEHKAEVCKHVIPGIIKQSKPQWATLVQMGWTIRYDPSTLEGRARIARDEATYPAGRIEDRPGRTECLTILTVGLDGESLDIADVIRGNSSPPRLVWREREGNRHEGRFVNALRRGFIE